MHRVRPFLLLASAAIVFPSAKSDPVKARAYVFRASKDLAQPLENIGVLDFAQYGGYTKVNGSLHGLKPGLHGFHIHEKGDLGNGCMDAGAHFNPTQKEHGGPDDVVRHVGDLGNINVPASGSAEISLEDQMIALHGPFSIIGRAVVVHEQSDDLGKGNVPASKQTGNAGGRVACGLIGIAS